MIIDSKTLNELKKDGLNLIEISNDNPIKFAGSDRVLSVGEAGFAFTKSVELYRSVSNVFSGTKFVAHL